ncbi:hypothetical protein L7F22_007351 [Adiantum nelumboides]|nr:hypothetical protein [Adiantum nelumboides]
MTVRLPALLYGRPSTVSRCYLSEGKGATLRFTRKASWTPRKVGRRRQSRQGLWIAGVAAGEGGMPQLNLLQKLKRPEGLSFGEELMRLIAGASSAPIAQYISSPSTPLHSLDPRVKQVLVCPW